MKKSSLALTTAALTGSLVLAGTTIASADEESTTETTSQINFCWAPAEEITTTIDDEEHTFKQEDFGLWRAVDNEELTLNRAEVMEIAKSDAEACGEQDEDAAKIQESIANNPPSSTTSAAPTSETNTETSTEKPSEPSTTPSQSESKTEEPKESSSLDEQLSSADGEPTDLGIAAIVAAVLSVVGAIAAIAPGVAKSLGIKLPF